MKGIKKPKKIKKTKKNQKKSKKIKNFSKKLKRSVDTFSSRVYIHIHRRTALLGSGKEAV